MNCMSREEPSIYMCVCVFSSQDQEDRNYYCHFVVLVRLINIDGMTVIYLHGYIRGIAIAAAAGCSRSSINYPIEKTKKNH